MPEVLENTVSIVRIFEEADHYRRLTLKRLYIDRIATHKHVVTIVTF
jgi:hypothetical protein